MANYPLLNDEVYSFPVLTRTSGGTVEPAPAGDTFSVVSNYPTLLAAVAGTMRNGGPAAVVNALVPTATNVSFTVSDSAGLSPYTQFVDIVEDLAPTNIFVDTGGPEISPQPVPVDPGAPVPTQPIVLPPDPTATPQRR